MERDCCACIPISNKNKAARSRKLNGKELIARRIARELKICSEAELAALFCARILCSSAAMQIHTAHYVRVYHAS
jgi:hypothetical protein